jgi:conjugal transfer ATP-binding protein TraC
MSLRDRASIAGHLPYDSFDPEGKVFIQEDGSLGLAWGLKMCDTEAMGEAELSALSDRLCEFFRQLPSGSAGQLRLDARRDLEAPLRVFLSEGDECSPLQPFFQDHARMLRELSIAHGGARYSGRTLEVTFTLRVFPGRSPGNGPLAESYANEKSRLLETARAVEAALGAIPLRYVRLCADRLATRLYRELNPDREEAARPRSHRPELPLRDQVVRTALGFDTRTGEISLGSRFRKVLSMVQVPPETHPGMLTRPGRSGTGILDLLEEGVLVLNFEVKPDPEMRRRFEKQDASAWRQLQGPRKKLEVQKMKDESEAALEGLEAGDRALAVRFHLVLEARDRETLSERSRSALGALDRLGLELIEEDALGLSLYLHTLPLGWHPASDRGLKRGSTMLSRNLADLLPLYGSYQGTPTPEVLLQNRRGEPITLSLFDSDVAPHAVVTGVSGAGKSFFMNYVLASAARRGGHVIVLDKGQSYRNLCELVGGQYVVFDPDRPLRINPVGRAEDLSKERLLAAKEILAELCAQGEEPVRKEERTVLEAAIVRAAKRQGSGEILLSGVYEALLEETRLAPRTLARDLDRLALALRPFVGSGAYAAFFDGPGEIDFSRPFTVFELADVSKRRELAPSLLMAILQNVAVFAGNPAHLSTRKYLVIDEAWSLLQSPATARFIEEALRTYRKLNAAAILVTQQVSDFSGPAGTAIRANAPNRIFLRQTAETVLAMEELFELTPEVKGLVASLVTLKGRFSEFLVETPGGRGVARLVPSAGLYTAFSTDGPERAALMERAERLRAAGSGAPLLDAIREAARLRDAGQGPGEAA